MPLTAQVAVADATIYYDKLYTYLVPGALDGHIFVGSMVLVPFGAGRARPRMGVVVALEEQAQPHARLKTLLDAAPAETRLTDELLAIVRYLKEATFCTWFEAARAVIPRGAQYRAEKTEDGWRLSPVMERLTEVAYARAEQGEAAAGDGAGLGSAADNETGEAARPTRALSAKQQAVLDYVGGGIRSRAEICEACGVGPGVAGTLVKRGLLRSFERDRQAEADSWDEALPAAGGYVLNEAQRRAADELAAEMQRPKPRPALLYGVTGSGKTPVFIELIKAALAAGKTALVLVPEIGLTPQMLATMKAAFGSEVAVQHSGLSAGQRVLQWRGIQRGEARVVVGTRSAVFAPLEDIGLVVVDEEQEHTYQSESAPRYDAIEVAKRRAARHGALLLLASATPSVATFYRAQQGAYTLHRLDRRYGDMPLPAVEMVDMGAELMAGNAGALSTALADATEQAVAAGRQVIILLNRRGYHRVALCRDCGKSVKCGSCSVPMVFHRRRGGRGRQPAAEDAAAGVQSVDLRRADLEAGAAGAADAGGEPVPEGILVCHHCGAVMDPAPTACPDCGGALRYAGFGTQRLEEELGERLPGARVLRMDTDTTARKGAREEILARFGRGEADILLGTQMVAKGLDFERVSLVGVVGIDSLLFGQSYRAFENVFALVTQVVGRSGRTGEAGRAMIQTVDPQNPVLRMAASQDYEVFYAEEVAFRKMALYPPFCVLCVVGFAAQSEGEAIAAATAFARLLAVRAKGREDLPLRVLGPAPMNPAQVAGSWRWRLTLKCRGDAVFRRVAWQVLEDYNGEGWPRRATAWLDFHAEG